MLFCLSDANISHFDNYLNLNNLKIKNDTIFLAVYYEFNSIKQKRCSENRTPFLKSYYDTKQLRF